MPRKKTQIPSAKTLATEVDAVAPLSRVNLEDVLHHQHITDSIAHYLRPALPTDTPSDLNHLTRCSKALHAAFVKALFTDINFQGPQWEQFDLQSIRNRYKWRPELYDYVKSLQFPEQTGSLNLAILFALRLPNLVTLTLPCHQVFERKIKHDFTRFANLERLSVYLGTKQLDDLIALPTIKSLALIWTESNTGYRFIGEKPTAGEDILLFAHRVWSGIDWPRFAPAMKTLRIGFASAAFREIVDFLPEMISNLRSLKKVTVSVSNPTFCHPLCASRFCDCFGDARETIESEGERLLQFLRTDKALDSISQVQLNAHVLTDKELQARADAKEQREDLIRRLFTRGDSGDAPDLLDNLFHMVPAPVDAEEQVEDWICWTATKGDSDECSWNTEEKKFVEQGLDHPFQYHV